MRDGGRSETISDGETKRADADAHGQAAAAHNLCRKDEQGDGQIGKVIDARIHLLCKRDQRTVPDLKRGNGQKTHGKADRNT